jgi:hypothetical protein
MLMMQFALEGRKTEWIRLQRTVSVAHLDWLNDYKQATRIIQALHPKEFVAPKFPTG